jgi:ABC-type lipoprotein export system ATPase subunit
MLKRLQLKNFTAFRDAEFDFSPGVNIIIGDNGTGKTHVLKLGYLFCRAWTDLMAIEKTLSKKHRVESYLEERLEGIFRVQTIANLVSQGHKNGASIAADVGGHIPTAQIRTQHEPPFKSPGLDEDTHWEIRLKRPRDQIGQIEAVRLPDEAARNAFVPRPIFVPSKEIVSLFKGLIGLFETYRDFPLDETYRDLAVALASLEPREPSPLLPSVSQRIQRLLGGDLKLENNDLVFVQSDGGRLESHLMAEGHRKLAMLVYLVHYRLIEKGSTVFWDEPEANLNPAAIRLLAEALYTLAMEGVQVIVATHSLFLLREFEILARREKQPALNRRYFALGLSKRGVTVSVGEDIAAVDPLIVLDEDLAQSDRYMETLE